MKRSIYLLFCFCAIFVQIVSASAVAQKRAVHVTVETVTKDEITDHIEALGTLKANESVAITANVTETLSMLHFDDGQYVAKGDLLVEMTSAEEHGLLSEANTNAIEAKRQLDRIKQLVKVGNASESFLDERQRIYDAAQARLIATESRLKDRVIRAPFPGRLGLRNLSVGALVRPGEVITTLNDNSVMKVDFEVPEIWLSVINTGLKVSAKSAAYPDRIFEGEVISANNQIDPVTRTILVRAKIPNQEGLLKQGMLMTIDLHFNRRDALIISESAIVPDGIHHYVYLVKTQSESHSVQKQQITLGLRMPGQVEVIEGLSAGDVVVSHGAFKLRENATVLIKSHPLASE